MNTRYYQQGVSGQAEEVCRQGLCHRLESGGLWSVTYRSKRGVDHPSPCSAGVEERVEVYLYFHSGHSWPVVG